MLCERCGNEFFRKPVFNSKMGRYMIKCPYCNYWNNPPRRKKKKDFHKEEKD